MVDAVQAAVEVQEILTKTNDRLADDHRVQFRIGVHVGDVMVRKGDLFGEGVNIAARIQVIAEPSGVCISDSAYHHVRKALPLLYEDLGLQQVKNIARPVRAFGLGPNAIAAAPDLPQSAGIAATRHGHVRMFAAFIVALSIAGAGCAWWLLAAPTMFSRQAEGVGAPAAPVAPARASIAVLPFTSLSADGDSDYFADGLTEDIISALGRFRELSVIARAAVFGYKGKSPTPVEVGRDLKVRYVLDGSIRRSPERFRVSRK